GRPEEPRRGGRPADAGGGRPAADALRPGGRQLPVVERPAARFRPGRRGPGRAPDGLLARGQRRALGRARRRSLLAPGGRGGAALKERRPESALDVWENWG